MHRTDLPVTVGTRAFESSNCIRHSGAEGRRRDGQDAELSDQPSARQMLEPTPERLHEIAGYHNGLRLGPLTYAATSPGFRVGKLPLRVLRAGRLTATEGWRDFVNSMSRLGEALPSGRRFRVER